MLRFAAIVLASAGSFLGCGGPSTHSDDPTIAFQGGFRGPYVPPHAAPPAEPDDEKKPPTEKVTLGEGELAEEFELEIAADEPSRARGLMGRTELDERGGMLFIYPAADQRSFWMAECRMDIEIIFLDSKGRVTATHEMKAERLQDEHESTLDYYNRLKRYKSRRPAQFAIEVKPGTLERLKIESGDVIELDVKRLTKIALDAERQWP